MIVILVVVILYVLLATANSNLEYIIHLVAILIWYPNTNYNHMYYEY